LDVMTQAIRSMQYVVSAKLQEFCSSGRSELAQSNVLVDT